VKVGDFGLSSILEAAEGTETEWKESTSGRTAGGSGSEHSGSPSPRARSSTVENEADEWILMESDSSSPGRMSFSSVTVNDGGVSEEKTTARGAGGEPELPATTERVVSQTIKSTVPPSHTSTAQTTSKMRTSAVKDSSSSSGNAKKTAVAWRWSPPEVLTSREFSEFSDSWSFGGRFFTLPFPVPAHPLSCLSLGPRCRPRCRCILPPRDSSTQLFYMNCSLERKLLFGVSIHHRESY